MRGFYLLLGEKTLKDGNSSRLFTVIRMAALITWNLPNNSSRRLLFPRFAQFGRSWPLGQAQDVLHQVPPLNSSCFPWVWWLIRWSHLFGRNIVFVNVRIGFLFLSDFLVITAKSKWWTPWLLTVDKDDARCHMASVRRLNHIIIRRERERCWLIHLFASSTPKRSKLFCRNGPWQLYSAHTNPMLSPSPFSRKMASSLGLGGLVYHSTWCN